ncbi:cilia- and flagella-associated protein 100 [Mycetomoellerius zeteki]|uniref:cilia- and flagella-associated protein 100 n=1 Tax=Mycetomoellerius zeteki TaxID=64791 RepID=UPI00084EBD5C|nr:PREDICTED: cilia- and flagella-associated protein 100-like [Trachymyrmex zeteki]
MRNKTRKMSFSELREVDQRIHQLMERRKLRVTRETGSTFNSDVYRNFSRMRRYWTSDHKFLNEGKNVRDEQQSPFAFPSCSQTLSHLQWWKMQKKKAIFKRDKKVKDRHKILQSHNILRRLHVTEEAKKHKELDKVIAMTDVDPKYFTELSGRPVKEKFSLKQYIQDIREILKTKLLISQEKDDCIRIDQQFEQETRRLRQIQYHCRRYVSGFEEFLSKDHEKSMQMLKKAEWEAKLTEEISTRRNELARQFGQSRLDIYVLEENWRLVKMCQMFLYHVSPVAWRIKYDWLQQSESERSITFVDPPSMDLFNRYKTLDESASLEKLIELFEQDTTDAGPAVLYFDDPFDLIRIFRAMETQNLNALVHLESLAAPMADMAMTITVTEAQIKQEINEITSTINDLEKFIIEAENRAANLKEYANYLLRDVFRHLVCSEEVLYLRVFVEDTYESCIGPNDANLDSFSMMKWIEKIHEELNLQLDNLPREIVRACEREGFRQEMKVIKEAEDAARKFELMHRLLDALKRVMEPPVSKKRSLIRRSVPIITKMKPPPYLPKPTDEEIQYLTFFTDYCRLRDDFVTYRSKFPDDFNLTFQSKRDDIEIKTIFDDTSSSREQKQEKEEEEKVEEKRK